MRYIMGVDPSLCSTGIVVIDQFRLVTYCDVVTSTNAVEIYDRINAIALRVVALASQFNCELISIEGLAYGASGRATRDLAGLHHVIVNQLTANGFNCTVVPPTMLKKHHAGNGRATKPDMQAATPSDVVAHFTDNFAAKSIPDLVDAYALAMFAI